MIIKKSALIVSTFLICFSIEAQDITFEEYNPTSTLVVPGKIIKKSKFPFIDVHGHQFRMATQDLSLVIAAMDTLNEAIMINLSGRSGDELKGALKNVRDHYPNRFVVFANINFEGAGAEGWTEKMVAQLRTRC